MLSPFPGYVPAGREPLTVDDAAARSRQIRDDGGRYQPTEVLTRAVAEGLLEGPLEPGLFRYEMIRDGSPMITGLVGVARAADLLPHEGTVASAAPAPAPAIEIRPILVLVSAALPRFDSDGPTREVIVGPGERHTVTRVDADGVVLEDPVIADGHHRRRAVMATRGSDATLVTLVVGDGGAGLSSGTFHRVFGHPGPLPVAASETFRIEPIATPAPRDGALVWHSSGRALALTPTPEALERVPRELRGSPAAVAQSLLYPLVGVSEDDAGHVADPDEAIQTAGADGAALLLPDVPISSVLSAARARTLLPPKASRFEPKPVRGLVIRLAT